MTKKITRIKGDKCGARERRGNPARGGVHSGGEDLGRWWRLIDVIRSDDGSGWNDREPPG